MYNKILSLLHFKWHIQTSEAHDWARSWASDFNLAFLLLSSLSALIHFSYIFCPPRSRFSQISPTKFLIYSWSLNPVHMISFSLQYFVACSITQIK
jgi:hypothetical protein